MTIKKSSSTAAKWKNSQGDKNASPNPSAIDMRQSVNPLLQSPPVRQAKAFVRSKKTAVSTIDPERNDTARVRIATLANQTNNTETMLKMLASIWIFLDRVCSARVCWIQPGQIGCG